MRKLGAILILCLSVACHQEMEKPDNLIPKAEMQEIVKEIYLYRQMRSAHAVPNLPAPPKTNLAIIQKHGVTLEQFKTSYQYYVVDNAAYDDFLEDIKESLITELPDSIRAIEAKKELESTKIKR